MLLVHARNVTGLGASQVVDSLVRAIMKLKTANILFVPSHQKRIGTINAEDMECVYVKSMLPNAVFRFVECLWPHYFYPSCEKTLVLGDIPLRGMKQQVVLVHQSNLIKPSVNIHSSKSIVFKMMRRLFEWNLQGVKYIVVQSAVMRDELIQSYPQLTAKVKVVPQPAPDWFVHIERKKFELERGLTLFYPAAAYPHKNHAFITSLEQEGVLDQNIKALIVTLRDDEVGNLPLQSAKVKNVGRLSPQECMHYYEGVDALFFPSVAESYGLPLVEAMLAGLPILCADLPYAHWMCEDEAIYFDPKDTKSAEIAMQELAKRLSADWQPDWSKALEKLPKSWDDVAQEFLELLK